jgi:hypothetical protein
MKFTQSITARWVLGNDEPLKGDPQLTSPKSEITDRMKRMNGSLTAFASLHLVSFLMWNGRVPDACSLPCNDLPFYSHVYGFNTRSQRLMEHVGFQREGILRQHDLQNGKRQDLHVYGILKPEFYERYPTIFTLPE